jgi:F0F1-type ATP synthase assembly protein I
MQFALTFLVCGAIGWWLDSKFGTDPWLMIGGILLGAGGAMYSLVRRLESLSAPRPVPRPDPHKPTPQPPNAPPQADRNSRAPR